MKPSRQTILNCSFDSLTENEALHWSKDFLSRPQTGYIATVNVAILMMMRRNKRLQKFISGASLIVADGQPIIWLSRLLGKPLPERVAGIDLCEKIAAMAAQEKKSVYLLGATDAILKQCEAQLCKRNPELVIAGRSNGYFNEADAWQRAKAIKESQADILFVAMGVPKQDYFIDTYLNELGVTLAIGLGGSFDVIGGQSKRAPSWMQDFGLEWLFRVIQEPRRLAKRYTKTNSEFLLLSIKELLIKRS